MKLFYGSSYDRGLQHLLEMWEEIKEQVPEATLDICYGWNLFEKAYTTNPERMQWKKYMDELMTQDGITHHGRVGKDELLEIMSKCGIWAYPTHFDEINCITALNAQKLGLVPVVINRAALKETVGSGIRIEGDIFMPETREEFKNKLIGLMKDKETWETERQKGMKFAKNYTWKKISKAWLDERP